MIGNTKINILCNLAEPSAIDSSKHYWMNAIQSLVKGKTVSTNPQRKKKHTSIKFSNKNYEIMRYIFLLSSRKTQNSRTSARYTQRNQKFDQEIHNQPRMLKIFQISIETKDFFKSTKYNPSAP